MPGGFAQAQDAGQSDHADGDPKADASEPCPVVDGQPGGNDFEPRQIRRLKLGRFARKTEVEARRLVERIEPERLFPGENGRADASVLPFSVAEVLQRARSRLQS